MIKRERFAHISRKELEEITYNLFEITKSLQCLRECLVSTNNEGFVGLVDQCQRLTNQIAGFTDEVSEDLGG